MLIKQNLYYYFLYIKIEFIMYFFLTIYGSNLLYKICEASFKYKT